MSWHHAISCFVGAAFLINAVPHVVSGVSGRPFQSPFATPRGVGLSSSTVNVVWGFFNLAVAYALICRVGAFDPQSIADVAVTGLGAFLSSVALAQIFGRLHGGNTPNASSGTASSDTASSEAS